MPRMPAFLPRPRVPDRINGGVSHPLRTQRLSVSHREFTAATRNVINHVMGLCAERADTRVCPYRMDRQAWGECVTREALPTNGVQHMIARFLASSLTLSPSARPFDHAQGVLRTGSRENEHGRGNSHGARIPRFRLSFRQGFQCLALTTFACTRQGTDLRGCRCESGCAHPPAGF